MTREGWLEPWTRVRETEADEQKRLNNMPRFLVANALNGIKPGATVLATVSAGTASAVRIADNTLLQAARGQFGSRGVEPGQSGQSGQAGGTTG